MDSQSLLNKKILVTGVNGQVGRALNRQLQNKCQLVTTTRTGQGADVSLDLSDLKSIEKTLLDIKPDIVINPAAYTQVDKAEEEPELAHLINGDAPGVMAEACKKIGALIVHYSTDYVFNGQSKVPYKETDPTDPINVYGASKLAGEEAIRAVGLDHVIFRTCWVYDKEGQNFPNTILRLAREREVLKVVNDQFGTPTSADFIAEVTARILALNLKGGCEYQLLNLRPRGDCSWYDFAGYLLEQAKQGEELCVKELMPVSSSEFVTKAARPKFSVLDLQRIGQVLGDEIADWQSVFAE